ncbi:MAG: hypothetical protein RBR34_10620, partial [Rhodospirillaceae bacterium]|nr:hypothetical protein [Rhodospirillaceae bacterium]
MDDMMEQFSGVVGNYPWIETIFWSVILILAAVFVNFVVKVALVRLLNRLIAGLSFIKGPDVVESGIIARLANAAPAMVIASWVGDIPGLHAALVTVVRNTAHAFNILVVAMAVSAALKLVEKLWQRRQGNSGRSIKGYIQLVT